MCIYSIQLHVRVLYIYSSWALNKNHSHPFLIFLSICVKKIFVFNLIFKSKIFDYCMMYTVHVFNTFDYFLWTLLYQRYMCGLGITCTVYMYMVNYYLSLRLCIMPWFKTLIWKVTALIAIVTRPCVAHYPVGQYTPMTNVTYCNRSEPISILWTLQIYKYKYMYMYRV